MTTRAEEIAADEYPHSADRESWTRDERLLCDGITEMQRAAFLNGYKQGQQDRWTSVEEALKSRGLHWFPEGSLLAWRRKRKPYHNYEHGIYRENENKARDQFSLKGCEVIILELPTNPEQP